METDLSLIEIVGEDDSLLQQIVNGEDDDNNNHSDVSLDIDFSCSPLQALRSKRSADRLRIPPAEVSEVNEERKKSRSPPDDIDSKENINESNSLVTNFTEEPQQMKRRRKGGGYNLRKSLAWNRAFFTEDGVLDPAELSLLSGSSVKSSSEYLPSVHEEELESLSECSDLSGDGSLLQSVEENLFKELPARSGNEDQKVASSLLLKSKASGREAAAPMHAASRKVQLAKGINRSVSQGEGCTRPSGSTSQKRLPNRNTTNSTAKDSKLPRYPALKPSSSVPMTSKTVILGTKHSKCNQNGPPVINIESNAGFKGSSNNTKNAPGCTSTSSKSSVHRSGKTLANLPLGTHLLANSQPPRIRKGTSTGLKVIPTPTPPAADMQAPTSHAGPGKIAVPLPQTSYCVGKNMQYANSQPTKPSGLRLPSPSLRFFDQPKASALHSVKSQRNTQPCKLPESNIPNVRSDHIGEVKPLNAPWSLPKVSADATTTKTMGVLGSTFGCSTPSVTSATHPTPKSNLGMKNLQKVEMEVSSISKSSYSQVNGSQLQLLGVPDGVDEQSQKLADALRPNPDEVGCNPLKHNLRSQMNNDTLLVQIESSEHAQKVNDLENVSDICSSLSALESSHAVPQPRSAMVVKEGVAGTDDMIKQPKLEHRLELIKGKPLIEKHDICSEMQSGDSLESCSTGMPMVHKDDLLVTHDFAGKADEQAELRKQGPDEVKLISHKNSLRLEMNDSNLIDGRSSEEFQTENDLEHITNVDPGIRDSGGSLLESTHVLSQLSSAIEVEEGAAEVDKMIKNLHAQNAQLEPLISNSSVENYNLICDSQRDATDNHSSDTLMVNVNCLRVGDNVDEQSGEHPEIRNPCPNEVEQILHKDYCTLQMTDKALLAEKRSEESQQDNNLENSINVTLKRKDSSESEPRSSHVVSQQIPAIQIKEGSAEVDNMINHSHLEEAVLESLNVNLSANSNFIPEGTETDLPHNSEISDGTEFQQDINLENANSVTSERRESLASKPESSHVPSQLIPAIQVKEDFAGVDNMTEHSHIEDAAQESSNVDLSAKSNVLPNIETDLPHNSKILDGTESQHNNDLKNTINVTPERRDSSASALKCSHVLSPLILAKRFKEGCAGLDNMTDHSHLKDAALGSLKINLSADSIVYSENTETDLPHSSKTSDGELQREIKNGKFPSEVKGARISANKKSMDDSKQDSPSVKYQMNAVPFTDEWLAALEAAGEEILTRKSGAVQNSPPDKPLLEPSPWSPVKRKSDQEIGPFDCTKYTNLASNSQ